MRSSPRLISVLAATIALIGKADAAALGEILAQSAIGEPLRVEIALAGGGTPRDAGECLHLAPPPAVPDGLPWLAKGEVRVAGDRVVVTSPKPAFDPVLKLALEDRCAAHLRREYALLLAYPETPRAAAPRQAPATPAAPPAARHQRAMPAADRAQAWTTAPGESIASLAHALFPKDAEARRRFVAATLKANPGLAAAPSAALPAGTTLTIPDLAHLPPAPGPRVARTATPTVAEPHAERRAEAKPTPKPAASEHVEAAPPADRLMLGGDKGSTDDVGLRLSTEIADPQRATRTGDKERDVLRREQHLIMALDRITETQLALSERIRRLEEIEKTLTERALAVGAIPAPTPAAGADQAASHGPAAAATPTPAPAAAPAGQWLYVAALFAGTTVVLALLLLRVRHTRRQDGLPQTMPGLEPAAAASSPEAAATAEDWTEQALPSAPRPQNAIPASPAEWGNDDGFFSQPPSVAPLIVEEEPAEEHDSAIELAEIMVSFGRVQGAAKTLAEFIHGNPKQAVTPWLKLLEVYRLAGLRPEFDTLARQLNKTFNVKTVNWENFDVARAASDSIEQMPHIIDLLTRTWRTRECQAYLQKLLRDNRDGTREGFPLSVIDEILVLSAVLEEELGAYRPEQPPSPPDTGSGAKRELA